MPVSSIALASYRMSKFSALSLADAADGEAPGMAEITLPAKFRIEAVRLLQKQAQDRRRSPAARLIAHLRAQKLGRDILLDELAHRVTKEPHR